MTISCVCAKHREIRLVSVTYGKLIQTNLRNDLAM